MIFIIYFSKFIYLSFCNNFKKYTSLIIVRPFFKNSFDNKKLSIFNEINDEEPQIKDENIQNQKEFVIFNLKNSYDNYNISS